MSRKARRGLMRFKLSAFEEFQLDRGNAEKAGRPLLLCDDCGWCHAKPGLCSPVHADVFFNPPTTEMSPVKFGQYVMKAMRQAEIAAGR